MQPNIFIFVSFFYVLDSECNIGECNRFYCAVCVCFSLFFFLYLLLYLLPEIFLRSKNDKWSYLLHLSSIRRIAGNRVLISGIFDFFSRWYFRPRNLILKKKKHFLFVKIILTITGLGFGFGFFFKYSIYYTSFALLSMLILRFVRFDCKEIQT